MTKFYLSLSRYLTVLLLFVTALAVAQNRTVTGKVTAADDGSALPGVNIQEKGTSNGAVTDSNGTFSITVGQNAVLVFSFVGFTPQEVTVGNQTIIDVSLNTDITALSEIVVIGYGQVEKKDLTGSVISVSDKSFNRGVMSSPQDLIVGKVAGVVVTQGSGAPGSAAQIRIRGGSSLSSGNDPLIVVDGFPLGDSPSGLANGLSRINPNDIETFTVLKDASATAIYGSRASNGVIIITTKKGRSGKPQLSYNMQVSQSNPIDYINVLEGGEYRKLVASLNGVPGYGIGPDAINRLGAANTNWQKQIFRSAWSQDHSLSLSGTTRGIPYRVSYGLTDQQGILKTTELKRHSVNINLTPSFLDDNLKVTASVKGAITNSNFGNEGAIGSAIGFDPTQAVKNGNTRYGGYFTWTQLPNVNMGDGSFGMNINGPFVSLAPTNPVALLKYTNNQGEAKSIIGNLSFDYRFPFLPEMRANLNVGIDRSRSTGYNNTSTFLGNNLGGLLDYTGETTSKLLDFYLNYTKEFGDHKVDGMLGHSYQSFRGEGTTFSRSKLGGLYYTYDLDYSDDTDPDGDTVAFKGPPGLAYLISFFGRVNYTYKGKYMATATFRSDGSSRFPTNNRWGLFPSVALAWRMKDEAFLQSVDKLSTLKLRVGWGITGQQAGGGSYPYLPTYIESTPTAQYQFGNQFYSTLRPDPYDAGYKWEETTTLNAGVDFGFLGDRITGAIDYYFRETKDLINFIPIAAGSNFSNFLLTNVGTLENRGIELTLNAVAIKNSSLTWNVGFNLSHNINEITRLIKTDDPDYPGVFTGGISGGVGNTVQILQVGHAANSFFLFNQVYDANGKPIEGLYVDRSGNGGNVTGNNLNKQIAKNPAPRILMGLNSQVAYKNFDFSFSGRFSFGNYVYNNGASNTHYNALYNNAGYFNNLREDFINDTKFVAAQYFSDHYLENASFFKMDNMSLGYNLDNLMNQKLKARLSFTVQNAFIITKYSGLDPEIAGGIDNTIYPRPRVFMFGVNLTY
jgi:TonB-dependent starch-binding outer membrane protein SusC